MGTGWKLRRTSRGIILTRNPLSGRNPGFFLHLVETLPPSVDKFMSRNPMSELSELNFVSVWWIACSLSGPHKLTKSAEKQFMTHLLWTQEVAPITEDDVWKPWVATGNGGFWIVFSPLGGSPKSPKLSFDLMTFWQAPNVSMLLDGGRPVLRIQFYKMPFVKKNQPFQSHQSPS